jgi:hypothetical protein
MTRLPPGQGLSLEEFRDRVRQEFAFLRRDFAFEEEAVPVGPPRYENQFAVWYANTTTRIIVEGINWGLHARVALGRAGPPDQFENFDLGDLLSIRSPQSGNPAKRSGGQLAELTYWADILRRHAADVLHGDLSVLSELRAIVDRRAAAWAENSRRLKHN